MERNSKTPDKQSAARSNFARDRKRIVHAVANELQDLQAKEGGRKYTTLELIVQRLKQLAVREKKPRAIKLFHRIVKEFSQTVDNDGCGYIILPARMSAEDWVKEQEELNKTRRPPHEWTERRRRNAEMIASKKLAKPSATEIGAEDQK